MRRGSRLGAPSGEDRQRSAPGSAWPVYEIEVIPGLEPFVEEELRELAGSAADGLSLQDRPHQGRIAIRYRGDPKRLGLLRSAIAVHMVETFAIRNPRALLGHEHFTRLLGILRRVIPLDSGQRLATFRLSAAGSDSPTLLRLKGELGQAMGLASVDSGGDLLIALRRSPDPSQGWQVLVRTSMRPLSARSWRVCDMPGALNATVANVMVRLAGPRPDERFLNLACGSGTLMIERLALGPAASTIGNDITNDALRCSIANVEASGQREKVNLLKADAGNLPLRSSSIDTLVADLPYGMLVGSSDDVKRMYPALVTEAARVAAPAASLVVITTRKDLFHSALDRHPGLWELLRTVPLRIPFKSGYIGAHIFHVRRTALAGNG